MSWLVYAGLSNIAVATLMAIPAWIVSSRLRRPTLAHALWFLVLLKLLTPPVLPVRILPMEPQVVQEAPAVVAMETISEPAPVAVPPVRIRPTQVVKADIEDKKIAAQMAAIIDMLLPPELRTIKPPQILEPLVETTSIVEDEGPEEIEPAVIAVVAPPSPTPAPISPKAPAPANTRVSLAKFLAGIWLLGSLAWLSLALRRGLRFRRWLQYAEPAPASVVAGVVRLSRRMGLARCPAVRLVPGCLPPMIWAAGSRAWLYFPSELLKRLDPAKIDTLFVHELAHLRRRDHWMRWFEIVTLTIYWWLPLVWVARRALQRAEEECCDARVLDTLPGSRRIYAEALLDAVDFLAGAPCLPPIASGITPAHCIKRRLLMILQGPSLSRLPMFGRLAIAVLTFGMLPLLAAPQERAATADTAIVGAGSSAPARPALDEPFLFDQQRASPLQLAMPRWWSLAVAPDGKLVAVTAGNADQPGELMIFDLATGSLKTTIRHTNGIRCCQFSPDGKNLVAGYFDGSIHLFDVATGKPKAIGVGHTGAVNSITFVGNKRLVSGALDHHVKVWTIPDVAVPTDDKARLPEFKPFANLNEHTNWVLSVAVSKDGKTIVSSSRDNLVKIWDMPEPDAKVNLVQVTKSKLTLTGHTSGVEVVAISPDGTTIASGSWDNSARIWDAKTGTLKREFSNQGGGVQALAIDKTGKELAIGIEMPASQPSVVRRFNLEDGKQLGQHTHGGVVRGLVYHPTAAELLSVGEERVIKRSNLTGNGTLGIINGPPVATTPQIVLALAYSPDGKQLAAGGDNKKVVVTSLADKQSRSFDAHDDVIWSVLFSNDGKTLYTASSDKTVKVWNLGDWKAGQPAPPVKVLKGHTNWVFCLALSPDGKKLASGSYDKSVRLWDLAAWKAGDAQPPVKVLKTHSASVHSLAFSPDGILLISGSADRTIRVWTVAKGEQLGIIRGHKGAIRTVAFSPDGKSIASGSEDKTVKLWTLVPDKDGMVTGKERAELKDHDDLVGAIAFSPRGRSLVAGTWSGQVYLWDPELAKRRLVLGGHSEAVSALAFSPDGQQFASGSFDKTVRLWPPTAPPSPGAISYTNHLDAVWSIALSKDGKWAVTGSRDGGIRFFERGSPTPKQVIANSHAGGVTQVAFSPDSQTLASVGKDKIVRIWNTSGTLLRTFTGHTDEILRIAFHPSGKWIATAGADKDIRIWDLKAPANSNGLIKTLTGHTEAIHGLEFSPNGKLLASAGMDRSWRLWDTEKWDTKFTSGPAPNNGHILALDFSPDGKNLAVAHSQDQEIGPDGDLIRQQYRGVMFIDTETGKLKTGSNLNAMVHPDWITGLAYSADGQSVITSSRDFMIRFWSIKSGQITRQFRAHNAGISQLIIAPEEGFIATAGEDRVATVWSIIMRTQSARAMLTGHAGQIWTTALSPDGELLATAGTDKRILLREGFRGNQPFALEGSYRAIYSIAVAADGKRFASGHEDGSIVIWDAATGKRVKTLTGHTMRVWSLAFSADGQQLYSSSGDWDAKDKPGEVKQWNLDDGKVIREFPGHAGLVYNLALSPDGKTLVTASHDKTIRVWDLTGKTSGAESLKATLTAHKSSVRGVEFSRDGQTLVSCGNGDVVLEGNTKPDGTVIFWDTKDWKEKSRFALPTGMQVNQAKFSPDGKTVAIVGNLPKTAGPQTMTVLNADGTATTSLQPNPASGGGRLLFWDVATGKVRKEAFPQQTDMILDVSFSPDGQTVAAVGGEYNTIGNVRFYDATYGNRVGELHAHKLWCEAVAYTRDGRVITGGGNAGQPGELKVWNAQALRAFKGLEGHTDTISFAVFRPDKKQLATGDGKGNVILWDLAVWPPRGDVAKRELKGPTRLIRSLLYTADGKTIIAGAEGGWVWMWDSQSGVKKRSFQASQRPIYSMALSPNGKLLATGHGNWQQNVPGEVKIWDMETGNLVKELPGFVRHVWNVAFTPDGTRLVTVGGQATARIWDTATWTEKMKLPVNFGVRALAISPDGKIIATASETNSDPVVHLWDAQTGQERATLQYPSGLLFCLRFTPDGKTLFGSGDNAAVHVWDVPPEKPKPGAVARK